MNQDDDFISRLEDYLESFEGATPLPDRVRDAVHASLPRTAQVRPARSSERMLDMISRASTRARWGLAAAVVVAAVVLGAAVLSNTGGVNSGVGSGSAPASSAPTPSPTPSPTPTPSPAPPTALGSAPQVACPPPTNTECLQPGTYRLTSSVSWPGQITLDVPAGWFNWNPGSDFDGVLVDSGPDAPNGSGWGLMFTTVGAVSTDPCDPSKGTFDPTTTLTVDGLVTAMRAWPGFKATAPTPITLAGYSGQLVELTSSRTPADCPSSLLWTTKSTGKVDAYPLASPDKTPHKVQFRILDVNGTVLVVRTTDFPETSPNEAEQGVGPNPTRHTADQVELHQMLDSIKVTAVSTQP